MSRRIVLAAIGICATFVLSYFGVSSGLTGHVCTRTEERNFTRLVKHYRSCRTVVPCGLWDWGRCTSYYDCSTYSLAYDTLPVTVEYCCDGWSAGINATNTSSCDIPVCAVGCENNGDCIAPDTCKCQPPYHGFTCNETYDPCQNYEELTVGFERSTNNTNFTTNPKCDSLLLRTWYKIGHSPIFHLPTTCPGSPACGTTGPVWMNTTNTSIPEGDMITLEACVGSPDSCCESLLPVQIKNCTDFTVYYLSPTVACPQAYCFEVPPCVGCNITVCPDGYVAKDGNCEDINECLVANGGCDDRCDNLNGSFACACTDPGYILGADFRSCDDVDECSISNGGCEDTCTNIIGSFLCFCNQDGYQLGNDSQSCEDINECAVNNGSCSDICINTNGSYHCECNEAGFVLGGDGHTCQAVIEEFNFTAVFNGTTTSTITQDISSEAPQETTTSGTPQKTTTSATPRETTTSATQQETTTSAALQETTTSATPPTTSSTTTESTTVRTTTVTSTPVSTIVQPCSNNPCMNNGVCLPFTTGVVCNCTGTGHTGLNCEKEDVFSKMGLKSYNLPRGCYLLSLVTDGPAGVCNQIWLSSTSAWFKSTQETDTFFTFGIVFFENKGSPLSHNGLQITNHTLTVSSLTPTQSVNDGTRLPATSILQERCTASTFTTEDDGDFLQRNSFLRSLLSSAEIQFQGNIRLEPLLKYESTLSPRFDISIVAGSELLDENNAVHSSCQGAPLSRDVFYNILTFQEGVNFTYWGTSLILPTLSGDENYCLILDMCGERDVTFFFLFPGNKVDLAGRFDILGAVSAFGFHGSVHGIGMSTTRRIEVKLPASTGEFWNGDEKVAFSLPSEANVWIMTEMQNSEWPLLLWEAQGDAFFKVPNPVDLTEYSRSEEYVMVMASSASMDIVLDTPLGPVVLGGAVAESSVYLSVGGSQPRRLCGDGANPAGLFFTMHLNFNPLKDFWQYNDRRAELEDAFKVVELTCDALDLIADLRNTTDTAATITPSVNTRSTTTTRRTTTQRTTTAKAGTTKKPSTAENSARAKWRKRSKRDKRPKNKSKKRLLKNRAKGKNMDTAVNDIAQQAPNATVCSMALRRALGILQNVVETPLENIFDLTVDVDVFILFDDSPLPDTNSGDSVALTNDLKVGLSLIVHDAQNLMLLLNTSLSDIENRFIWESSRSLLKNFVLQSINLLSTSNAFLTRFNGTGIFEIGNTTRAIKTLVIELRKTFQSLKMEAELIPDTFVHQFVTDTDSQLEQLERDAWEFVQFSNTELIQSFKGFSGFGIKFVSSLTVFGIDLGELDLEYVYSSGSLAQCSRYSKAYALLQGKDAVRIMGMFQNDGEVFKFFKKFPGAGLELAIGINGAQNDIIVHGILLLDLPVFDSTRIDVFISKNGLDAYVETVIVSLFRIEMNVYLKFNVPEVHFRLGMSAYFVPGPKGFDGSLWDSVINIVKEKSREAQERISAAQDAVTKVQTQLQEVQEKVNSAKAAVLAEKTKFDNAVKVLEDAERKVEEAKIPFQRALDELARAQRNVDNLCQIRDCPDICLWGLTCRICSGWIPFPCCQWVPCAIRIPDIGCLIANALCRILRAIAYAVLELAKIAVRIPMIAMDIAKGALQVAQITVKAAKVFLDVAVGFLDLTIYILKGIEWLLEFVKAALEVVKFILRGITLAFEYFIRYGIASILDIKRCGFGVEINARDFFLLTVSCEFNAFRTGWTLFTFRIDLRNIFLNILELAFKIVKMIFEGIGRLLTGRGKRSVEYLVRANILWSYKHLRGRFERDTHGMSNSSINGTVFDDIFDGENVTIDSPESDSLNANDSTEANYIQYRINLFKRKCDEFSVIDTFLTTVAEALYNVSSVAKDSIDNASTVVDDLTSMTKVENISLNDSGFNKTDAYVNYNLTENDLEDVIANSNVTSDPVVGAYVGMMDTAVNATKEETQKAKSFPIGTAWRQTMENYTRDTQDPNKCSSFEDCLLMYFYDFYRLYLNVSIAQADTMRQLIPQIEDSFLGIVRNDTLTTEDAVALSGELLSVLLQSRETKVFCATAPNITVEVHDIAVLVGQNVTLTCNATGEPEPYFEWQKDGEPIYGNSSLNVNIDGNVLEIPVAEQMHDGYYACVAVNHVVSVASRGVLKVEEPPSEVMPPLNDLVVLEGYEPSANITCNVTGDPFPTITWTFETNLSSTNNTTVPVFLNSSDPILKIPKPRLVHAGFYQCSAENKHGLHKMNHTQMIVRPVRVALPRAQITMAVRRIAAADTETPVTLFQNMSLDGLDFKETIEMTLMQLLNDNVTVSNITHLENDGTQFTILANEIANSTDHNNSYGQLNQQYGGLRQSVMRSVRVLYNYGYQGTFIFTHGAHYVSIDHNQLRASFDSPLCPLGYEHSVEFEYLCAACMPGTYSDEKSRTCKPCQFAFDDKSMGAVRCTGTTEVNEPQRLTWMIPVIVSTVLTLVVLVALFVGLKVMKKKLVARQSVTPITSEENLRSVNSSHLDMKRFRGSEAWSNTGNECSPVQAKRGIGDSAVEVVEIEQTETTNSDKAWNRLSPLIGNPAPPLVTDGDAPHPWPIWSKVPEIKNSHNNGD